MVLTWWRVQASPTAVRRFDVGFIAASLMNIANFHQLQAGGQVRTLTFVQWITICWTNNFLATDLYSVCSFLCLSITNLPNVLSDCSFITFFSYSISFLVFSPAWLSYSYFTDSANNCWSIRLPACCRTKFQWFN